MMIFVYISALIIACYIGIQLVVLVGFLSNRDLEKALPEKDLPFVSILIAARNEERNILYCLTSLCGLNYPKDKYEILIGNDRSEDHTEHFVREFIKDKPLFTLYNIEQEIGLAKGKANVLAQLAHKAIGDYLLITDADIEVQPEWVHSLVAQADEKTAIVSGITIVNHGDMLDTMQHTDWLYFMALMQGFVYLGIPATAVGNNMLVSRKAYDETGGYEQIPFSVTEDFKLFQRVRKLGWKTKNVALAKSVNYSRGLGTVKKLIQQRKRWLTGAKELPLFWWFVFGVFGMFWPAIIILAMHSWVLGLQLYLIKLVLQWLYIVLFSLRLHLRGIAFRLLQYELYSLFITIASAYSFFMPSPVSWKGRSYTA
jgi:cellulose synthase/poly-beta-1,6-N-acetylglucosamine synthase-like glycosyltransferase